MPDNKKIYSCEHCGSGIDVNDEHEHNRLPVICGKCQKTQDRFVPIILLLDFENMDIGSWRNNKQLDI